MRKEGTGLERELIELERELIEEFVSGYRPSHTYIFWDRPDIEKMSPKEFVSYVESLRQDGKKGKHELELLVIRFVEAGKISDAVRIFTHELQTKNSGFPKAPQYRNIYESLPGNPIF